MDRDRWSYQKLVQRKMSVDDVFQDYFQRRDGLVSALFRDQDNFLQTCASSSDKLLCLYGLPDGTWELTTYVGKDVEIPNPTRGLNIRDQNLSKDEWLKLVAKHCDSWLLSTAFYICAEAGFDKKKRKRLFEAINKIPTLAQLMEVGISRCMACGADNIVCINIDWVQCETCSDDFHNKCLPVDNVSIDNATTWTCHKCVAAEENK